MEKSRTHKLSSRKKCQKRFSSREEIEMEWQAPNSRSLFNPINE